MPRWALVLVVVPVGLELVHGPETLARRYEGRAWKVRCRDVRGGWAWLAIISICSAGRSVNVKVGRELLDRIRELRIGPTTLIKRCTNHVKAFLGSQRGLINSIP